MRQLTEDLWRIVLSKRWLSEGHTMKYDVIIVGAGTAGSIIAARLTEDAARSVLLLEAGPDYPDMESLPYKLKYGLLTAADIMPSDHDWKFTGRATAKAAPMLVPRGKVTGGSSAVNGQIFLRGIPEDFDAWAAAGNTEWSFAKVLPFFKKSEQDLDFRGDFHGADGPVPIRRFKREEWLPPQEAFYEACLAAGFPEALDFNDPNATGVGPTPLNNLDGIRWSMNVAYLNPARHRPNLTIRPNCTIYRIVLQGKRATGVMAHSGGESLLFEADEVILSAGPIGSPHLLMLSGIGPADQLTSNGVSVLQDLPGVGQNLRDHPGVGMVWRPHPGYYMDPDLPRYQVLLRYTAEGSHLRNDMQIFVSSFGTGRVDRGGDGRTPVGISMRPVLNLAVGQGEIILQSPDPAVQPLLDYNFLAEEFDRQRLREGVRLCLRLVAHASFQELLGPRIAPPEEALASDSTLDDWMMREVTTTHHISGTCRMGSVSDPMAVVDQYGRVHGIERLRVADLSILPDCVRANTNATAIMVGERVSDFILRGD
jgi:choline dehydrogenase